jgi:hypothetical protein
MNLGGLGDHPLDGKPLVHPRDACHALPHRRIPQRARDRVGERVVIAHRDGEKKAVDPVLDDLGIPPARIGDDRPRARHRVEQRHAQPSIELIRTGRTPTAAGIDAEAGQRHVFLGARAPVSPGARAAKPSPRMTKRASGTCCATRWAASIG